MSREPNVRAEFGGENGKYIVKISVVGDPNVFIDKANIEYQMRFPREWEAFIAGKKEPDVGGTPLTEVPGMTEELARSYKTKGVRNAEELANAHDMALSKLGMGAVNMRKNAQILMKAQQTDRLIAAQSVAPEPKKRGRPPKVDQEQTAQ
jgi:hypothetical protein